MIVAMTVVKIMQPALYQIINVVPMRDSLMSTSWPMHMTRVMPFRSVSATIRVFFVHFDGVFIHLISMHMFEVSVLQIIGMSMMFDSQMPATRPVLMSVFLVFYVSVHKVPFLCSFLFQVSLVCSAALRKRWICKPLAFSFLVPHACAKMVEPDRGVHAVSACECFCAPAKPHRRTPRSFPVSAFYFRVRP